MSGRMVRARLMPRGVPQSAPDPVAERLADAYYAELDAEMFRAERAFVRNQWRDIDLAASDPLLHGREA